MFKQISTVVGLNIGSIPQRLGSSLVIVIGVACVVATMVSLLAIAQGVIVSGNRNSSPDQALVLSSGASAEYMGAIARSQADIIGEAPGVKRDAAGKPMSQPRAMVIVEVTLKKGATANIGFVGTGAQGWAMSPDTKIIAGRRFKAGLRELVAGRLASQNFKNLGLGDHITLRGSEWTVVGIYENRGGVAENGIIADADTVLAAFDRNAFQSVQVQLDSPASFQKFKDALTSNPQLNVTVKRASEYIQDQLKQLTTVLQFVGYFVGGVMAVGAVFGAINTMYSAVDARAREIATLRAIGFGGFPVVISVLVESLVLSIPGALIGSAVAWLVFNGQSSQIAGLSFPLAVTPGLMVLGVIWSLIIGLIGGFAPAIRAARLPVATALRAT
jgi:putative ABC transport system permease protein